MEKSTDYQSPLEHSSSPDGCREDCPACEDERLHEVAGVILAEALETWATKKPDVAPLLREMLRRIEKGEAL